MKPDLETLVLGALRNGPLHGYGIVRLIRGEEEIFKVGEGQLYPLLRRMESDGLVEGSWEIQDGRPARKVYSLTEEGTRALDKHKSAFSAFTQRVSSILGLPEGS